MADRMLILAVAVSVFGVLLVSYISPSIRPPMSNVSHVSASSLGKAVRFEGRVSRIHVFRGGGTVFKVTDGVSAVDVYLPPQSASKLNLSRLNGSLVEVSGVVQLYDGRVEVVVDGGRRVIPK